MDQLPGAIARLFCRIRVAIGGFTKGRDWYDFGWYVRQRVTPNLPHLQNALVQFGPWQGRDDLVVDPAWLSTALQQKIDSIDWRFAAADVERFLQPGEQKSLELWSVRFFSQKLSQLACDGYLNI